MATRGGWASPGFFFRLAADKLGPRRRHAHVPEAAARRLPRAPSLDARSGKALAKTVDAGQRGRALRDPAARRARRCRVASTPDARTRRVSAARRALWAEIEGKPDTSATARRTSSTSALGHFARHVADFGAVAARTRSPAPAADGRDCGARVRSSRRRRLLPFMARSRPLPRGRPAESRWRASSSITCRA